MSRTSKSTFSGRLANEKWSSVGVHLMSVESSVFNMLGFCM